METHRGKSVPVVKDFQTSWVPVTPGKPNFQPQPIYDDGQGGLLAKVWRDSEEFIARHTQPQTLLSYSISSAEQSSNPTTSNNFWDTAHGNHFLPGRMLSQRENAEVQRRGLEDYLPRCSQGRRSMTNIGASINTSNNYTSSSPWESQFPLRNNGLRENGTMLQHNSADLFGHCNDMSFRDLMKLGDNISAVENGGFFPGWVTQPNPYRPTTSIMSNHNTLLGINHPTTGVYQHEMQNCAFPHPYPSVNNSNLPPRTEHHSGKNSTFAPATPDLRQRIESTVTSGNTHHDTNPALHKLNMLQEHEVAAVMVNLHDNHNEETPGPIMEATPGKDSMAVEETHDPDKEGNNGIDLNKTPQKKSRRRRYQPKVVTENKPKRTPKPKTPKPTDTKETQAKRKYVRKNKMNTPPTITPQETTGAGESETKLPEIAARSCRKSLNFDLNGEVTEHGSFHMSNGGSNVEPQTNECHTAGDDSSYFTHFRREEELVVETSGIGIAYDLNRTVYQQLNDYLALHTEDVLESSQPDTNIRSRGEEKCPVNFSLNSPKITCRTDHNLPQSPNSSPCASSNEKVQTKGSKRSHSCIFDQADVDAQDTSPTESTFCQPNHTCQGNTSIQFLFPEICKKKRTEKVQRLHTPNTPSASAAAAASEDVATAQNHQRVDPAASNYYYSNMTNNQPKIVKRSTQNKTALLNAWPDIARLNKKKRSKSTTRARDLAPSNGIASVLPADPAAEGPHGKMTDISNNPYSCMGTLNGVHSYTEAQAVVTASKLKRRSRKQDSVNKKWELVVYEHNQSTKKATGCIPAKPRVRKSTIAAITRKLEQLDINKEKSKTPRRAQKALVPYHGINQEQNALVPYMKDGTIVPFEGPFDPVKKRRQRAKVDLDDETTRVWRLLLENIDNQGIDGTDEDKARWWDNERTVFTGRVDSFIARMRLVQGDRRFTPWKGSVLDSVIGVFLTQNVSDHLSSSAFMSLAARFPLKQESCGSTLSEEETSALVVEPEIFIIEPEESNTWTEKIIDQPIFDRNSRIIQDTDHSEEKEVVNSKEARAPGSVSPNDYSSDSIVNPNSQTTETETASIVGDDKARDDATSSQQSVISSQNSTNSPNLQTVGITSTLTQDLTTSSQPDYFDCSTSFMGLLKMADPRLQESYSQACLHDQQNYSSEAPGVVASNYQFNLKTGFQLQDTKGIEILEVESRSSDMSRKDENSPTTEQSNLTVESTEHLEQERSSDSIPRSAENICSYYVLEGEKMVIQSQQESVRSPLDTAASTIHRETNSTWKGINLPSSSPETADATESTRALERSKDNHKEVKQIPKQNYASGGGLTDMANVSPSKTTKGKAGKGKKNEYDWDNLRKEAQVNGKNRGKTANTRDSLDWEAVRHANVGDIAETIKERGMNNMLAERIKDLLDRLVRDHGSIELEWLRDIPPDKAKEYLLSFRGLGLKSVECVRLLTLHHLAFPVDTNVGRIAVRLGWVPLQPLPESLQLHLLEMYPILESIQKFLWPRLCKLDQKTLYELHYHMITFGKVFCTKRQPNCNACPLRGECRHFASAFASARFALPGPEERSIMPSSRSSKPRVDPRASNNLLPAPPSWSNYPQANSECTHYVPGSQVPPPLSLPSTQTVHLERKSINSICEPIVEVPASPEPEPQQEQELQDIEDSFYEDPDEIPTIQLNMKEFTKTLQTFMHTTRDLQEAGASNALVSLTPEAASIPTPKLKNINRLRTEHHVYELPDTHPLLQGLDKRETDDPCSYLLAIWTPGETPDSIQPPARRCSSDDPSILCHEETCSYCSSQREANSQVVRGTLLIPCRTAMRGSFPLNGTYFQVNEVFADHESSLNPIAVPRSWLWNLPRRTVYFGTSIPTIFRGLTTEDIQHCFWRGYVCVRGFDKEKRTPRPLMARLHFPASKLQRAKKVYDE